MCPLPFINQTFKSLFQPSDLPTGVQTRVVGAVVEVCVEEYGEQTVLEDVRVKPTARRELALSPRIPDQIFPAAVLEEVRVECVVLGKGARRAGVVVAHDGQDFGVGKALPDERGDVPFGGQHILHGGRGGRPPVRGRVSSPLNLYILTIRNLSKQG